MQDIEWESFTKFWTPEPGKRHQVVLQGARHEVKEFRGEQKDILCFDVIEVDGEVFKKPKIFNTSGGNALKFRPVIEYARDNRLDVLCVIITRDNNNRYKVEDIMPVVEEAIEKRPRFQVRTAR